MSKELQDDIFGRLSNSDLLKFIIRQLQNASKAKIICSTPFLQLLTIQQTTREIQEYINNYVFSLLTLEFYDQDISIKIKAKFGLKSHFQ